MNAGKKVKDSGRSGFARNKLLGALGHVHNPFSTNSRKGHDVDDHRQDENAGDLRAMNLQVEITRAEASLVAYNLAARIQKS